MVNYDKQHTQMKIFDTLSSEITQHFSNYLYITDYWLLLIIYTFMSTLFRCPLTSDLALFALQSPFSNANTTFLFFL